MKLLTFRRYKIFDYAGDGRIPHCGKRCGIYIRFLDGSIVKQTMQNSTWREEVQSPTGSKNMLALGYVTACVRGWIR
jgi:hypothetical protein